MNGAELYEMLDRLPDACDDFIVRFTTRDRTEWVEPQAWRRIGMYIWFYLCVDKSDSDDQWK